MAVICKIPSGKLKPKEIIVTADIINQGTWYNGSHSVLTNQQNGSAGFTLVGRRNYAPGVSMVMNQLVCWAYKMDITDYETISYYVRKNADHGISYVIIADSMTTSTPLANNFIHYNNLTSSWTQKTLDVTNVTGEVYVIFVGGYSDSTGNTTSSTSYCDIHIS